MGSILVKNTCFFEKIKKISVFDTKENSFIDFNNLSELEKKCFYLYEYSDDLLMLDEGIQYPSILNYIKTGILTEEEVIQALLYKQVSYGKETV